MMILLEIAIENLLNEKYNKSNNIDEACKSIENEFHAIKIIKETDNEYHNISVYSSNSDKIIASIKIPNKK